MRSASLLIATFFVLALSAAESVGYASAFDVDSWLLSSSVLAGGPNSVGTSFTQVTNPFVQQHEAHLLNSAAQAAYNFLWTDLNASFTADLAATAQGPSTSLPFISANSGTIRITPFVDVQATLSAAMTYSLAPGDREVVLGMDVLDVTTPNAPTVFSQSRSAAPIFGYPPADTWTLGGTVILHPGSSYTLTNYADLKSYSGSQTQLSNYTSHVQFTLTALPEPGTLSLLALAAASLTLRRARRH